MGGFVGCIGGGSNAADGASVNGGIRLENLANHAYVYCTDSKGLGGIVGYSMASGSIINCYNDGLICANYAVPTGGIIGANESMDIFCCYNRGSIYGMQSRDRGIGSDNAGKQYAVDSCYYLENCGNDTTYPGYYAYNLGPSIRVNVTELSESKMKSNTLLNGFIAYVTGDGGYLVLYWEKGSNGAGELVVTAPNGGTISAEKTGEMDNGTVVYLDTYAETGWNFRYYTLNGTTMTGDYVTVNGACDVSAHFESVKAGVLKIAANSVCNISITKNGTVIENGAVKTVTDYPVQADDTIYEGDALVVQAMLKDGMELDDPDISYKAAVGMTNLYEFQYQYTGGEVITTNSVTFTVGSEINSENTSLSLTVVPLTTQKLWKYQADTDWYSDSKSDFTITMAEQLAGLAVLVNAGKNFSGKTVKLGCSISLANNDGSDSRRYWDGIGTSMAAFAGCFDGQGYQIRDYHGSKGGLFNYCFGVGNTSDRAAIKNLTVYGDAQGSDACGITAYAKNADISNCHVFKVVTALCL